MGGRSCLLPSLRNVGFWPKAETDNEGYWNKSFFVVGLSFPAAPRRGHIAQKNTNSKSLLFDIKQRMAYLYYTN
jgi:hypothetical protein